MADLPRIISAELEASAASTRQFPLDGLPEVAVVGRSNVGKSSLINALTNNNSLARTSKSPGRTQLLHFFKVVFRAGESDSPAYLVDFPGFGYAKVSKEKQASWSKVINQYFGQRQELALVVLLIDARRDVPDEELWIVDNIGTKVPIIVVLTKADKLNKSQLNSKITRVQSELDLVEEQVIAVSVMKGKRHGLDKLTKLVHGFIDNA
jgi:GTP-binding protein